MSILAAHITNKELMSDSGLGTVIDHYSAMHFGQCFTKLEKMERGLTRSLRQAIWSISTVFGETRVISFITEVDKPMGTYVGTDHYPEVCQVYEGQTPDVQTLLVAWAHAVFDEYRDTATYAGRFDDAPQYPDFQDAVFVDYDVKTDFRGQEMIVPAFRFVVPKDWEDFNTVKKQQLARAINMMIWLFRQGLPGPFKSAFVRDKIGEAVGFLTKWRQDDLEAMTRIREAALEAQPNLLLASPESFV